eukprot:TRINITY_DN68164_c0_g1_i1.p1 TRINITY_DN68164_c0_g1~~TRINITY_DN68164_c0_g1_i1.p1  ORF type:complete len:482 (+),score=64.72 TRINITY_DN68164_c0_g1_i1:57-1502(+)
MATVVVKLAAEWVLILALLTLPASIHGADDGSLAGRSLVDGGVDEAARQFALLSTGACAFQPMGAGANHTELDSCMEIALHSLDLDPSNLEQARQQVITTCVGLMQGLATSVTYANSSRGICWATPGLNLTGWSCEALTLLSWEVLTIAWRYLAICTVAGEGWPEDDRDGMADDIFKVVGEILRREVAVHTQTPLGAQLESKLLDLRKDLISPLSPSSHARQLVSRLLVVSRRLSEHANFLVWRDTHFLWLHDTLQQGEVVHTAWGPIEGWDELGANDARSRHPLAGSKVAAPIFAFSDEVGQRNDILVSLLRKLHKSQGSPEQLIMVEIGVFRAGLSKFLLEKLPFLRLLGVDPYVGVDGTFPGDFSRTLNPDDALSTASAAFAMFGDRATLLPMTSEEAARQIPEASLDAVFVDGCHLYDCVTEDLRLWAPKLRRDGQALLAGHDFSPQWPGVVRAVHEARAGRQQVVLGQDWMYWWYP